MKDRVTIQWSDAVDMKDNLDLLLKIRKTDLINARVDKEIAAKKFRDYRKDFERRKESEVFNLYLESYLNTWRNKRVLCEELFKEVIDIAWTLAKLMWAMEGEHSENTDF